MRDEGPPPSLTLIAAAATAADRGRALVRLNFATLRKAGLKPGDLVRVAAGRATLARVLPAGVATAAEIILMDPETLVNTQAEVGSSVVVEPASELTIAERVTLRVAGDGQTSIPHGSDLSALLMDTPVSAGDLRHLTLGGRATKLEVVSIDPENPALVGRHTRLDLPIAERTARYASVGGLRAQTAQIREMVELPMRRPDLFARLGIDPPRGVLFTGPPGSGKTLLARAVAEETEASFFPINGPEIVSKHYGDSEKLLREVFDAAVRQAPSIIFIDEIDAIAPKRASLSGEKQLERRVVAQLLTLMDGLSDRGQVVVMAATNLPQALDPALRRPGRFDRELSFPAPDRSGRREIIDVHLARAPLAGDVDLDRIAAETHGYVGADLAALAREAGLAALARWHATSGDTPADDLFVTMDDLDRARAVTSPSTLRESRVESPDIRWSDIGGLGNVKQSLIEAVVWPLAHADLYRRFAVRPAAGVLLAGPPGAGKTLLARALAAESGVNLIPVRAAQLLSQFLGEAERAVAEVFQKARHAAPCILFMDELDALAPARGRSDPALERVVAQLLVEIDGLEDNRGIFLLGATNRPGAIDPALTRPGRFDRVIAIAPPDRDARLEILAVHSRALPLAADVDLDHLAEATEGWTGADLAALCQGAAQTALRRILTNGPKASDDIHADDFAQSMRELRESQTARNEEEAFHA